MPIQDPTQLVEEFKKSGEFDKLRQDLLAQFRAGDNVPAFMTRVEEIVKQKLSSDHKLHYLPENGIARELMQELDRYPIVERAVGEMKAFSDPAFEASIRQQVSTILKNDRHPPSHRAHLDQHGRSMPRSDRHPVSFSAMNGDRFHIPAGPSYSGHGPGPSRNLSIQVTAPIPSSSSQQQGQSSTSASNEEEKPRSVHFTDTSSSKPSEAQEEPGSPGSAMQESPLTEERPSDAKFP